MLILGLSFFQKYELGDFDTCRALSAELWQQNSEIPLFNDKFKLSSEYNKSNFNKPIKNRKFGWNEVEFSDFAKALLKGSWN